MKFCCEVEEDETVSPGSEVSECRAKPLIGPPGFEGTTESFVDEPVLFCGLIGPHALGGIRPLIGSPRLGGGLTPGA